MKNRQLGEDKKGRKINSFLHPPILSFILSRTIKCFLPLTFSPSRYIMHLDQRAMFRFVLLTKQGNE